MPLKSIKNDVDVNNLNSPLRRSARIQSSGNGIEISGRRKTPIREISVGTPSKNIRSRRLSSQEPEDTLEVNPIRRRRASASDKHDHEKSPVGKEEKSLLGVTPSRTRRRFGTIVDKSDNSGKESSERDLDSISTKSQSKRTRKLSETDCSDQDQPSKKTGLKSTSRIILLSDDESEAEAPQLTQRQLRSRTIRKKVESDSDYEYSNLRPRTFRSTRSSSTEIETDSSLQSTHLRKLRSRSASKEILNNLVDLSDKKTSNDSTSPASVKDLSVNIVPLDKKNKGGLNLSIIRESSYDEDLPLAEIKSLIQSDSPKTSTSEIKADDNMEGKSDNLLGQENNESKLEDKNEDTCIIEDNKSNASVDLNMKTKPQKRSKISNNNSENLSSDENCNGPKADSPEAVVANSQSIDNEESKALIETNTKNETTETNDEVQQIEVNTKSLIVASETSISPTENLEKDNSIEIRLSDIDTDIEITNDMEDALLNIPNKNCEKTKKTPSKPSVNIRKSLRSENPKKVSNVFKPKEVEYSFSEPMEVDETTYFTNLNGSTVMHSGEIEENLIINDITNFEDTSNSNRGVAQSFRNNINTDGNGVNKTTTAKNLDDPKEVSKNSNEFTEKSDLIEIDNKLPCDSSQNDILEKEISSIDSKTVQEGKKLTESNSLSSKIHQGAKNISLVAEEDVQQKTQEVINKQNTASETKHHSPKEKKETITEANTSLSLSNGSDFPTESNQSEKPSNQAIEAVSEKSFNATNAQKESADNKQKSIVIQITKSPLKSSSSNECDNLLSKSENVGSESSTRMQNELLQKLQVSSIQLIKSPSKSPENCSKPRSSVEPDERTSKLSGIAHRQNDQSSKNTILKSASRIDENSGSEIVTDVSASVQDKSSRKLKLKSPDIASMSTVSDQVENFQNKANGTSLNSESLDPHVALNKQQDNSVKRNQSSPVNRSKPRRAFDESENLQSITDGLSSGSENSTAHRSMKILQDSFMKSGKSTSADELENSETEITENVLKYEKFKNVTTRRNQIKPLKKSPDCKIKQKIVSPLKLSECTQSDKFENLSNTRNEESSSSESSVTYVSLILQDSLIQQKELLRKSPVDLAKSEESDKLDNLHNITDEESAESENSTSSIAFRKLQGNLIKQRKSLTKSPVKLEKSADAEKLKNCQSKMIIESSESDSSLTGMNQSMQNKSTSKLHESPILQKRKSSNMSSIKSKCISSYNVENSPNEQIENSPESENSIHSRKSTCKVQDNSSSSKSLCKSQLNSSKSSVDENVIKSPINKSEKTKCIHDATKNITIRKHIAATDVHNVAILDNCDNQSDIIMPSQSLVDLDKCESYAFNIPSSDDEFHEFPLKKQIELSCTPLKEKLQKELMKREAEAKNYKANYDKKRKHNKSLVKEDLDSKTLAPNTPDSIKKGRKLDDSLNTSPASRSSFRLENFEMKDSEDEVGFTDNDNKEDKKPVASNSESGSDEEKDNSDDNWFDFEAKEVSPDRTPSPDSNEIIEVGESIGSDDSIENFSSDDYEMDSFICDEESPNEAPNPERRSKKCKSSRGQNLILKMKRKSLKKYDKIKQVSESSNENSKSDISIKFVDDDDDDEDENTNLSNTAVVGNSNDSAMSWENYEPVEMSPPPSTVENQKNSPCVEQMESKQKDVINPDIEIDVCPQSPALNEKIIHDDTNSVVTAKSIFDEDNRQNSKIIISRNMIGQSNVNMCANSSNSLTIVEKLSVDNRIYSQFTTKIIKPLVEPFCSKLGEGELFIRMYLNHCKPVKTENPNVIIEGETNEKELNKNFNIKRSLNAAAKSVQSDTSDELPKKKQKHLKNDRYRIEKRTEKRKTAKGNSCRIVSYCIIDNLLEEMKLGQDKTNVLSILKDSVYSAEDQVLDSKFSAENIGKDSQASTSENIEKYSKKVKKPKLFGNIEIDDSQATTFKKTEKSSKKVQKVKLVEDVEIDNSHALSSENMEKSKKKKVHEISSIADYKKVKKPKLAENIEIDSQTSTSKNVEKCSKKVKKPKLTEDVEIDNSQAPISQNVNKCAKKVDSPKFVENIEINDSQAITSKTVDKCPEKVNKRKLAEGVEIDNSHALSSENMEKSKKKKVHEISSIADYKKVKKPKLAENIEINSQTSTSKNVEKCSKKVKKPKLTEDVEIDNSQAPTFNNVDKCLKKVKNSKLAENIEIDDGQESTFKNVEKRSKKVKKLKLTEDLEIDDSQTTSENMEKSKKKKVHEISSIADYKKVKKPKLAENIKIDSQTSTSKNVETCSKKVKKPKLTEDVEIDDRQAPTPNNVDKCLKKVKNSKLAENIEIDDGQESTFKNVEKRPKKVKKLKLTEDLEIDDSQTISENMEKSKKKKVHEISSIADYKKVKKPKLAENIEIDSQTSTSKNVEKCSKKVKKPKLTEDIEIDDGQASTSIKIEKSKKKKVNGSSSTNEVKFHPKDFKNEKLLKSKKVHRISTDKLLKKKGIDKYT